MKRFFLYTCLLGIVMSFFSCEKEQEPELGSIYGVVTDLATGNPVQSANVQLQETGETTQTGSDGAYEFLDIEDGKYTLKVTKVGYSDLLDDHIITVKNGRRVKRDVQIEKLTPKLTVVDENGNDVTKLDFGDNPADVIRSFFIFNKGDEKLEWSIEHECAWISSIVKESGMLKPDSTQSVKVTINRNKLNTGDNSTTIHILSNGGTKQITVSATKISIIKTLEVKDIHSNSAVLYGILSENMSPAITEYGFVYSTSAAPTLDNGATRSTFSGSPNIGAKYSSLITDLEKGTRYYAKAYATNGQEEVYGDQISFITIDETPILTTLAISNLKGNSATSGGIITNDGGLPISECGVCWSTTSTAPTIENSHTVDEAKDGKFISQMNNLVPETRYYVRAYARNSFAVGYGDPVSFTTTNGLPQVTTKTITNIQGTSATGGGVITDDGGSPIRGRGVCWSSTLAAPTIENSPHTTDGAEAGDFVSQLTNLQENTTYYVRAYATNETGGTNYGNQETFTTIINDKATVVQTLEPTNVTTTSATLNGNITQAGYPAYTERGFCYNTSGMPTIYDTKVPVSGNGTGAYTKTITIGINDYYVRAYAIQNGQPIYGQQVTFGPELVGPSIFIGQTSNVGPDYATITATISNAGSPKYTKRGFCYGQYADPTIESGNCTYVEETASNAEEYSMTLRNLQSNTLYYVKAYVEWMGRRVYSGSIHFYTEDEVTVLIENELISAQCVVNNSQITWSGMLLGGTYTSTSYVSLGFVYDKNPNPTVGNGTATQVQYSSTQTNNNVLGFFANVSGLENATSYYVRAYVQMSYGYVYSDQIIIQMHPIEPNIQTYAIANLQSVNAGTSSEYWQAQFQGVLYADGTPPIQDWGFVYGTSSNPTVNDGSSIMVSRQQHVAVPNTSYYAFATNVTGLQSYKVYYVRVYAKTAAGYTYGGVLSFTTY